MYSDYLLIIFIATCTAIIGEALTYVLVYRSEHYKRLKNEMERKTKKLERKVCFSDPSFLVANKVNQSFIEMN